ncbi:MAG: DUF1956 domain-containing protein [Planctomycetota bacterium]
MRSLGTRERLIEAAGEAFACVGYDKASVRQICKLAKTNVSSVSYHFGDKAGLYEQVVCSAMSGSCEREEQVLAALSDDPRTALRQIVEMFAVNSMNKQRREWHKGIFMREMDNPRCEASRRFRDLRRRIDESVHRCVRAMLSGSASDLEATLVACSIIGQCLHFFVKGHIVDSLAAEGHDRAGIHEAITRHILKFSEKGMTYLSEVTA